MPRRKKNGHSPSRVPDGPPEGVSLGYGTASRLNRGFEGVMANNFPPSSSLSSTVKEEIVQKMQEMFSHLDTEVIDIVLSECDFKVENAMDSLLELSVAAEVAAPILSPVSGFERTAAVLLSPCHFSEFRPDSELSRPSQGPSSPPSTGLLTEELDLLVDQELQILTKQRNTKDELHGSQYLSSFPHPQFPQQALPELLHSSLQPGSRGSSQGLVEHISGASSPLDQVSNLEDETVEKQQSMVDFTHLMAEASPDRAEKPFNLATSGRSSAFQVYKKQDPSSSLSDNTGEMLSHRIDRGARSKAGMLHQEELGVMQSALNVEAPVFSQRVQENHRPAFITPVAQPPSIWTSPHRHASHWLGQGITSQAPLKPYAPIPKSWALPAPQPPTQQGRLRLQGKVLVLLRGAAGSGKTTVARALVEHNPGGVTLSTDDYFARHGEYLFDPTALGEAHAWNHNRAKEAFERGANPIIIDNTNMLGWEMRPYVVLALKHGYKVLFREPDTWWKNKPRELERRSSHNVPLETIRRMLNEYERFVTVQSIMGSQMPEWKQRLSLDNRSPMSVSSEPPCPDLIGQPESTEECMKSRSQLCSSLPDVSSISHCSEIGLMEHGANKSTESINIQPTRRLTENPEISEGDNDMNSGGLDLELNAQVGLIHPAGDQRIPDCIVELVMNEDRRDDEMTVAFSDSIGQRVRRERSSRISRFDRLEPVDLVKDTNQSDSEACDKEKIKDKDADCFEMMTDGGEKGMLQVSDFIGDWPSLGLLEQRQVKRRVKHKEGGGEKDDSVSQEANESQAKLQSSPKITEFQRLLDLIQTGVADIQTGSSLSSSPSLSSGGGLDQEEEASGRFEVSHSSSSNSEEREQNMNRASSNRSELPDCVINWRASDSCNVGEPGLHDLEGLQTENESSNKGGNYNVGTASLDLKSGITPLSSLQTHSLLSSKCVEANLNNEIVIEPSVSFVSLFTNNTTASSRETTSEAGGNYVSEVCQSQVCEVSVETESGPCSGGSQERKQRQSRRSGKQCKLALTFTQNCPISSLNTLECPNVAVQSITSSIHADVKPKMDFNRTPYLDSNQDPLSDSKSEAHLQPPSPKLVDLGCPSQTEPQDFAFLWRLDHQESSVDVAMNAYSQSCDIAVLSGVSSRFVPEMSAAVSAAVAVNPSSYREIPYHVVHEKSTQVEEKELGAIQDRLESLRILSCHFKLVGFDTLEDLYDKCHQDLEWTTNLLLDSGERFFREEDDQKMDKGGATDEENQKTFSQFGVSDKFVETRLCPDLLDEHHSECCPTSFEEGTPQSTIQILTESCQEDSGNANVQTVWGATVPLKNEDHPDTTSDLQKSPQTELNEAANKGEGSSNTEHEMVLEGGATGKSSDDGDIIQKSGVAIEETEEMASLQEVQRLLLAELDKMQQMESQKEREKPKRRHMEDGWSQHLEIQSVELKLPTEVALQLTELFGPVGVDAGTCCSDDHLVQMDLSLAKLLHQKWKETIQEKQRQATLSYHLLQESSEHWGDLGIAGPRDRMQTQPFLLSADGYVSLDSQSEAYNQLPYMNHWNVSQPHISLRAIMKEEQALQENMKKMRHSRADLDRRDGATQLKENQLYSLFPTIDRHFLQDIFRDHNYNLTQTEIFLRSLLNDEEPVKTVVAPEAPRSDHHRTASKEREQRQKPLESTVPEYQDTDDPEYVDFRAEASLQKQRQLENLSKAAEAFKQGHKEVASFYAQQGHLHGRRMREANHRAAAQIFERVNASLLPNNILDLHGLHVDEALQHLAQVLKDKSTDCEQGLCRLQLSVITGRGNHSQGGVARIRPAVIDYLTNRHYRFTEPKPGLVLVSLK